MLSDLYDPLIPKNSTQIDPIPVDTLAPLSLFAKSGYYVVDKKIFRNKIYAMQEATRKRLGPQDVSWIFNNSVYDSQDWKTPSSLSLSELYRLRAQQLRNKYDYLMLSFSGGGDSTNVLDSFVLNNIPLDEVVVGSTQSQTAEKCQVSLSTDARNFASEWHYLIMPKIKWLQMMSPKTKITIVDPYDNLVPEEPDEHCVEITTRHNYIGYQRYKAIDKLLMLRQSTHKNNALIMGVNPPDMARINRHFFTYFKDDTPAMYASDITKQGLQRNVEFFYWTPDMPEIVIKQIHSLLDSINQNPIYTNLIPKYDVLKKVFFQTRSEFEIMRRWVKSVLYPSYDHTLLQVDKNTSPINTPEWFSWFHDNPHSQEIIQPHLSGITSHQNLIDPKFFVIEHGQIHNYYSYQSKLYHIGDLNDNF